MEFGMSRMGRVNYRERSRSVYLTGVDDVRDRTHRRTDRPRDRPGDQAHHRGVAGEGPSHFGHPPQRPGGAGRAADREGSDRQRRAPDGDRGELPQRRACAGNGRHRRAARAGRTRGIRRGQRLPKADDPPAGQVYALFRWAAVMNCGNSSAAASVSSGVVMSDSWRKKTTSLTTSLNDSQRRFPCRVSRRDGESRAQAETPSAARGRRIGRERARAAGNDGVHDATRCQPRSSRTRPDSPACRDFADAANAGRGARDMRCRARFRFLRHPTGAFPRKIQDCKGLCRKDLRRGQSIPRAPPKQVICNAKCKSRQHNDLRRRFRPVQNGAPRGVVREIAKTPSHGPPRATGHSVVSATLMRCVLTPDCGG